MARSTVYKAARGGVVGGVSPKAKGPKVEIPQNFASMEATHAEVCQVGDGELKGRDIKRLIGASMIGTKHEAAFKAESVWRKVRKDFPESLKAANKIAVDDARAQWTTFDNLNQWFDDVKRDLLTTGLVVDEQVFNDEGGLGLRCNLRRAQSEEILTRMRRIVTCQSQATRVVHGQYPTITLPSKGVPIEVSSQHDMSPEHTQPIRQERHCLQCTYLTPVPSVMRISELRLIGSLGFQLLKGGSAAPLMLSLPASMLYDHEGLWMTPF